jgi:hypothetical protein
MAGEFLLHLSCCSTDANALVISIAEANVIAVVEAPLGLDQIIVATVALARRLSRRAKLSKTIQLLSAPSRL